MKLSEQDIDLLSSYFEGELPEAEMKSVEERLDSDPAFREAAVSLGLLTDRLADHRTTDLRAKFSEWDKEMVSTKKNSGRIVSIGTLFRAAAIILPFLLVAYWLFIRDQHPSDQALADMAFDQYDNDSGLSTLGAGDLSGYEYFDQKKYPEAIGAFLKQIKEEPDNPLPEYFLGVAYFANKQPEVAIPLLKKFVSNENINTYNCKWYLALSHLRLGEKDEAASLLRELSSLKNAPGPQAADLLEKIK